MNTQYKYVVITKPVNTESPDGLLFDNYEDAEAKAKQLMKLAADLKFLGVKIPYDALHVGPVRTQQ